MTQFTLNIPTEKVQSFLKMMVQTGFNQSILAVKNENSFINQLKPIYADNQNQKHPYFDWEFYNNDLLIN